MIDVGKFNVTGTWGEKPKVDETYHIMDNNGREWDSKLLSFSGETGTFNPPSQR